MCPLILSSCRGADNPPARCPVRMAGAMSARRPEPPAGRKRPQMTGRPFQQHGHQPELSFTHPIEGILAKSGGQPDRFWQRKRQQQRRLLPALILIAPPDLSHDGTVAHLPDKGSLATGIAAQPHPPAGRVPGRDNGIGWAAGRRKGGDEAHFSVVFPQSHVNHMLHPITFIKGEKAGQPKYDAANSGIDLYQS